MPTHRQVKVQISNLSSKYILQEPAYYLSHGSCKSSLNPVLNSSENGDALFINNPLALSGVVGVFIYDITDKTSAVTVDRLAVMFSNPFDFDIYSNWYGVGEFNPNRHCDFALFNEMYNGKQQGFVRGEAKDGSLTYKGRHVTINASMSDCFEPILEVKVSDN